MRTNLHCPPPVTSVHLVIHMAFALTVSVVALRDIDQVTRELGISIKSPNTLQDITEVELERVTCYNQVLTLEWRAAW